MATGKSTVGNILRKWGYVVIDADKLSREVCQQGGRAYREIFHYFGSSIVGSDGEILRQELGKRIFSNLRHKSFLENLLYPLMDRLLWKKLVCHKIDRYPRYWFYEAALLIEKGTYQNFAQIWLTVCSIEEQKRRLMLRKQLVKIEQILLHQWSTEEKHPFAHRRLLTEGSRGETKKNLKNILDGLYSDS